jgi:hypothetical protein
MHEKATTIWRLHVVSAIWFAVTLGMTGALAGPADVLFAALGMSTMTSTLLALGIGLAAGSLAAELAWVGLQARSELAVTRNDDQLSAAPTPAFVASRSSLRS